jgi:exodeoxyribonuclease VII large subunit
MQTHTEPHEIALTVFELNQRIKSLLESGVGVVWLKGEISNFKLHSSGHFYLSIKDKDSQIKGVMFRGLNSRLRFKPTDGLEVLVRGQISVYIPRGEYQIYIEHMEPVGAGALQKAFEQLKLKLAAEGLFKPERKRPIPKRPRYIGVVTSETGAAIQDILNILSRRCPSIPVTIVPTLVQGIQAAPKIIEALRLAYTQNFDVIILARGGGSAEDMWCFNDETLARVIAESPVPIISAVGHEIDFTISDFVADLRAPTPSAAAELVAQSDRDLIHLFQNYSEKLKILVTKQINLFKERILQNRARLIDPQKKLRDLIIRHDELNERLKISYSNLIKIKRIKLSQASGSLFNFKSQIVPLKIKLNSLINRLSFSTFSEFKRSRSRLEFQMGLLDSLSPLQVLKRGFSYQLKESNVIFHSVSDVEVGDMIYTVMKDGRMLSKILEIKPNQG